MTLIIYLLFFLSGASALVYQVVWFRSLQLLIGSSHLAVTVVLSVFMAGLALGSHFIGKRVQSFKRPLIAYGLIEIGVATKLVSERAGTFGERISFLYGFNTLGAVFGIGYIFPCRWSSKMGAGKTRKQRFFRNDPPGAK